MNSKERAAPFGSEIVTSRFGPYDLCEHREDRLAGDPLFLADFALPVEATESVLDIGTGTGVIPILLSYKSSTNRMVGVEIEESTAILAEHNVRENGLAERVSIHRGDYRELDSHFAPDSFDLVISNPPYIKRGEGRVSPERRRALARYELEGTLSDLLDVSCRMVSPSGRICFVFPVKREGEMVEGLKKRGFEAKRFHYVDRHGSGGEKPKLFMIEAARRK